MGPLQCTLPRAGSRAESGFAERGFTLIEMVVLVAIVSLVAGFGYAALAQRPAQARTSATAFAGLVSEANALAAITDDAGAGAGSGATIGVVRDGDQYVATLYMYRPILGAKHLPSASPHAPPLRTTTDIAITQGGRSLEPPFALFISPAGHASVQVPFTVGIDASLAAEPACPLPTGILIAFIDGVHNQAHALSCELAQLDLDTAYPVPPGAQAP
jgi:prepilin-type N-terminal cleavage/methylation domain-containing protein